MKKIPTVFERDWDGDRSRVTREVHTGCEWVLAGEGRATRKLDGTCCMSRDGKLYKRREIKEGQSTPPNFEWADYDSETEKTVGWVPVGDGPEDKWANLAVALKPLADGTYELVGPRINGNPERFDKHYLIPHGEDAMSDCPRTFDGLSTWLAQRDIEGIVFHHPDGRMAKIKARDFGIKRQH